MELKSQSGIAMINLIIYISSFLIITIIIAGITTFFYNNTALLDKEVYSSAEYNKLNMYFVNESEQEHNSIVKFEQDETSNIIYIEFVNNDIFTLDKKNNLLYYNKICLCEDVQDIQFFKDYDKGKEILQVKVKFSNKTYSNKYTMKEEIKYNKKKK